MSLEITAKLVSSLPEQTGSGKNGPWVKQDFIVETEDQYPKKICMSAWGDLVKQFNGYTMGSKLKISFRIESREYNGRWYTDVRPWKAVVESNGTPGAAPMDAPSNYEANGNNYNQPAAANASSVEDDLPF